MDVPDPDPAGLAPIRNWLAAEPAGDCLDELDALRRHLITLDRARVSGDHMVHWIGPLAVRVADIAERFRLRLLSTQLPLPHAMHDAAVQLIGVLLDCAGLIERLAAAPLQQRDDEAVRALLAAHGLGFVMEAYRLACMAAVETVPGLWARGCALYRALAQSGEDAATLGTVYFKRMIAVATLQPESLTARELAWLFDYLAAAVRETELADHPSMPENASFWIDCDGDAPPVAWIRRTPPAQAPTIHFHARALARRLGDTIDWLESRIAEAEVIGLERDAELLEPETSGLPPGLTPVEVVSLLRRMRERWITPPNRVLPRRAQHYTVQACVGLGAIWRMLRRGEAHANLSKWAVSNESPGGFALVSVSGVDGAVAAGAALALRRDTAQPWTICIVRWLRGDRPGVMEMGLQAIAHGCTAVSVGFRGNEPQVPVPALMLPPLAALRRHHAILAPAGSYTSRRFVLMREAERLYVAQGRVLNLDLQTASVEVFQYEIDPYAL